MSAHVAIVANGQGGSMAVRFASLADLDAWAEENDVFVISALRLGSRAEAKAAAR